jgi:hypothetical protein
MFGARGFVHNGLNVQFEPASVPLRSLLSALTYQREDIAQEHRKNDHVGCIAYLVFQGYSHLDFNPIKMPGKMLFEDVETARPRGCGRAKKAKVQKIHLVIFG